MGCVSYFLCTTVRYHCIGLALSFKKRTWPQTSKKCYECNYCIEEVLKMYFSSLVPCLSCSMPEPLTNILLLRTVTWLTEPWVSLQDYLSHWVDLARNSNCFASHLGPSEYQLYQKKVLWGEVKISFFLRDKYIWMRHWYFLPFSYVLEPLWKFLLVPIHFVYTPPPF